MVSTRKKKHQDERLLSQISESDADCMIGQSNYDTQADSTTNEVDGNTHLNDTNDPTRVRSSPADMHNFEKNTVIKVQSEVDDLIKTAGTRVQDAILSAMENSVIPRVELAIKSLIASSIWTWCG